MRGEQGRLVGVILVEADKFLMFGRSRHSRKMKQLQDRFKLGKLKEINEEGVGFSGRRLSMVNGVLYVDMEKFVKERLMEAEIAASRRPGTPKTLDRTGTAKKNALSPLAAASLCSSELWELLVTHEMENIAAGKVAG